MKRKRLDRDVWWEFNKFKTPLYYQMRVDIEQFHGLVCFIKLIDGKYHYWDMPIAGKTAVIGNGMTWLQLIPDGQNRVITAMYLPDDSVSLWYVDVIESIEYDKDGVAVFIDKYLDVIFTPQGDIKIDDRVELDEAFRSGDITKDQYDAALRECDLIISELCSDITKTEFICSKILCHVYDRIAKGEKRFNNLD
jgi:predicted RNA-binding protein associated with RNAse of E/G family